MSETRPGLSGKEQNMDVGVCRSPWIDQIDGYIDETQKLIGMLSRENIESVAETLYQAWLHKSKVIILGNGGSAATASHFANDLNKGCAVPGRHRFLSVALTDSVCLLTAWGNDAEQEDIFAGQLPNYLQVGDIVVAISGSGNSPNVLKAIEAAKALGAVTIGLAGFAGGKLAVIVDHHVIVPGNCVEQIEDAHLLLTHCICTLLRSRIIVHIPAEEELVIHMDSIYT